MPQESAAVSREEGEKSRTKEIEHAGSPRLEDVTAQVGVTKRLALLTLWAAFGAISYGFSAAVISSSLGQP